jgi:hypothetical protein
MIRPRSCCTPAVELLGNQLLPSLKNQVLMPMILPPDVHDGVDPIGGAAIGVNAAAKAAACAAAMAARVTLIAVIFSTFCKLFGRHHISSCTLGCVTPLRACTRCARHGQRRSAHTAKARLRTGNPLQCEALSHQHTTQLSYPPACHTHQHALINRSSDNEASAGNKPCTLRALASDIDFNSAAEEQWFMPVS